MRQPLVSNKITPEGLRLLKQIAMATGEKQYAVLARLLAREWQRVQQHGTVAPAPQARIET